MRCALESNVTYWVQVNDAVNFCQLWIGRVPTRNRTQNFSITPVRITESRRIQESEIPLVIGKIVRRNSLSF